MLKIITVCGLGVGSSLIMKMTAQPCDVIVTSNEFRKNFEGQDNVVYVNNFVDVNEMKEKLDAYLTEHNLK